MRPADNDTAVRREHQHDQVAGSFLVRVWYETSESGQGEPTFRGYVRNLQTGAERFLSDPRTVTEEIVRQIGEPAANDEAEPTTPSFPVSGSIS